MTEDLKNRRDVLRAIETSCIPLLYGGERAVLETARMLFAHYGIVSFTMIPRGCRRAGLLTRLSARPFARTIPLGPSLPALVAETAIRFVKSLGSETALPVLVDCSDEGTLLSDRLLRETLESHFFVTDPARLRETPPFSYLTEPRYSRDA